MIYKKVKEKKNGQMEANSQVIFKMERKKEMENLLLQMDQFTREVFTLGKWKGKVKRQTLMNLFMKVNLKTIEKMAKVSIHGLMEETTKEILLEENETDLAFINGQMAEFMLELGKMENKMEEANSQQVKMT